ncbi:MAG TPA: DUF3301 domain-containing protein [Frateuria sp.]|uniref:DUF3301 domain-containing protein n=1 Tax=Frateuria sp. TaxID=2211372 RepID=UPI002D7F219E|nr:DUF3301 domain-containing protein [Frateuria sp.]HET6806490.1 DUF3301 domain-containing protein [Frateuria sp.]
MSQVSDLIALLGLAAVAGAWLKFTRARERAVDEARRQCAQHGLQLLDETVGLRSLRWRRVDGGRQLELGYAFEVSAHGDDRLDGRLWMHGDRLASVSLPSVGEPLPGTPGGPPASFPDNVVPFRAKRPRIGH